MQLVLDLPYHYLSLLCFLCFKLKQTDPTCCKNNQTFTGIKGSHLPLLLTTSWPAIVNQSGLEVLLKH